MNFRMLWAIGWTTTDIDDKNGINKNSLRDNAEALMFIDKYRQIRYNYDRAYYINGQAGSKVLQPISPLTLWEIFYWARPAI